MDRGRWYYYQAAEPDSLKEESQEAIE